MKKYSYFSLLLLAFTATGLSGQIAISNFSATAHGNNVLRYDIGFSTSVPAQSQVQYGYWTGSDSVWNTSEVGAKTSSHSLTLLGLHPQTDYSFRVYAFDTTECTVSSPFTFSTDPLPGGITFASLDSIWAAAGIAGEGYVLVGNASGTPQKMLQVFDRTGKLIWYEAMPGDAADSLDGLFQSFRYAAASHSIFLTEGSHVMELALDGSTLADVDVSTLNPNWYPHHDAFRNSNGDLVSLVAILDTIDKSSVGGSANAPVLGHGIVEVEDNGSLVWDWSAFDYYDPLSSPGPGGYWAPHFGPQAIDWKHANSVAEDLDGSYLICFEAEDAVVKIDRQTKNPLWTVGEGGNIDVAPQDSFHRPQSIRVMSSGHYLLWDGESLGNRSRLHQWWIDWGYAAPMIMVQWDYKVPAPWFSPGAGNVEYLKNGHMFFSAGESRGIFEVDPDNDSLLWFARADMEIERAFWLADLYQKETVAYTGDTSFCLTDSMVPLTATVHGGLWSGNGVTTDGMFNTVTAGAGSHTITYKYGATSLMINVHVDDDPNCSVALDPRAENLHKLTVFPNPFTEDMVMDYALREKSHVEVCLFGTDGREIAILFKGTQQPGTHRMLLDLNNRGLVNGPYLLRIRTSDGKFSSRLIIKDR